MTLRTILALVALLHAWPAAAGGAPGRAARFADFKPSPARIWDAPAAPEMVLVAPGRFEMGPRARDVGLRGNELARRNAVVARPLAVAVNPVTVAEFAAFVADTGHDGGDHCWTFEGIEGRIREGRNWRNPGFVQTPDDPVLCVSRIDVDAYIAWLKARTGRSYRLLSETEYEYVNRAGTDAAFWWGEEVGADHADCDGCGSLWDNRSTAPVGRFAANPFGLRDTTGNTWSWTSDCYITAKARCAEYAIRGGAWHSTPPGMRVFSRFGHTPETHSATLGFRLAREIARP